MSPDLESATLIRVSPQSTPGAVGGAIAGVIRQHKVATVQAIGVGAVSQAVEAITMARGYLVDEDIVITYASRFIALNIDGQERSALQFDIEPQPQ